MKKLRLELFIIAVYANMASNVFMKLGEWIVSYFEMRGWL